MDNSEYGYGWGVFNLSGGDIHVSPLFDIWEHVLEKDCPCCPKENGEGVYVHNSFDGREDYEEGRRKPH